MLIRALVEDEVARLDRRHRDVGRRRVLGAREVRQAHASGPPRPRRQTGAVERVRPRGTPHVGLAELSLGFGDGGTRAAVRRRRRAGRSSRGRRGCGASGRCRGASGGAAGARAAPQPPRAACLRLRLCLRLGLGLSGCGARFGGRSAVRLRPAAAPRCTSVASSPWAWLYSACCCWTADWAAACWFLRSFALASAALFDWFSWPIWALRSSSVARSASMSCCRLPDAAVR